MEGANKKNDVLPFLVPIITPLLTMFKAGSGALPASSPFDHQLFSFFVIFLFEERLITPHFRGDLLLENVYPQIHL